MELNAETVKKALDWLDSLVGNSNDSDIALLTYQLLGILYDTCEELTEKNAIQAITAIELDKQVQRLTEENERLRADNVYGLSASKLAKKVEELSRENDSLRNRVVCKVVIPDEKLEEIKSECLERVELDIKAIEADTVRKMQERLKSLLKTDYINGTREQALSVIDQIAKEMLEGE